MFATMPTCVLIFLIFAKIKKTRIYMLLFLIWQFYFDNEPLKGTASRWKWFRRWPLWKWSSEYFPVKLVKTADLPPDKGPYMIAAFPHGILPFSIMCNFITDGTDFKEKYPGIPIRVAILNLLTQIPVVAQLSKHAGAIRADRKALESTLQTGQSVVIVPGGAKESLLSIPNKVDLIVGERKGFVKIAVEQGAALVPCLSLGESDLFNQFRGKEDGIVKRAQKIFQRITTFAPPIIMGRGFFNYSFGLLPHRREIKTIIGSPIYVQKTARNEPDFGSLVDYYHNEFMLQLEHIYAEHRNTSDWNLSLSEKQRLPNMTVDERVPRVVSKL